MKIRLRKEPAMQPVCFETEAGTTIENIMREHAEDVQFRIYAARLNNKVVPLNTPVTEDSEIVLLDMRDPSGKECYQNSLLAMYLYAVEELYHGSTVKVSHSLNKGVLTFIKEQKPVEQAQADAIEKIMRNLSKAAVPFSEIKTAESSLVVPHTDYIRNFDLVAYAGGVLIRMPQETAPKGLSPYEDDKKLFQALSIEREWDIMLGIRNTEDLNEKIESGEINDIIRVCEALHEKRIAEIADKIVSSGKRIVLIAGPSSSGKTSFAKRLCTQLWVNGRKPLYLGTDDYYKDRNEIPFEEDGKQNFEDLSAVDVELFNRDINKLLAGEAVDIPEYNFKDGVKEFGKRIVSVNEGQPIVLEGIHGLNDALTPSIAPEEKFKIYISPLSQLNIDPHHRIALTDIRKLRRMVRDAQKRGWDASATISVWYAVRQGEAKNIFPYANLADEVFNSSLAYELAALKAVAKPMLTAIPKDSECYCEAQRLLTLLENVDELSDISFVPNNSLLREFVGGSVLA